jgi:hypothetical protein
MDGPAPAPEEGEIYVGAGAKASIPAGAKRRATAAMFSLCVPKA